MNNFNEKPVTEVSKEEPILTINLRYSYKDYIRAKELECSKVYKTQKYKMVFSILVFTSVSALALTLSCFIEGPTQNLSIGKLYLPICIILNCFWLLLFYYSKKKRNPLAVLFKFKIKHYSVNRILKKVKKNKVSYSLSFYDMYLIKTTQIMSDMHVDLIERKLDSGLLEDGKKIEYITLCDLNENDTYISFCSEIFIIKSQIKEENKEKLKLIMKKIYLSQHTHIL